MDVAILVSSYERPWHLRRVLTSIACQNRDILKRIEVVVTDDGSTDDTANVVQRFARTAPFPVRMTTHPHSNFQLARCRNEGVAASTAPYLLFLDGDCLIPPDHVWQHLRQRSRNTALAGYCYAFDKQTTANVSLDVVRRGTYLDWVSEKERRKLRRMDRKARFYSLIRHPRKPKLFGGNIGIWRADFERVNGYDQNFVGWGCEDDDLRIRLRMAGIRIRSILRWTRTYHLWHPAGSTTPTEWKNGENVKYFLQSRRPAYCVNGIKKVICAL